MAKFQIPQKTSTLKLSNYVEGFGELKFEVWVNPPRRMIILHDDIERRAQQAIKESQWVNGLIIKAKTELTTCAEEDRERINEQIRTHEIDLEQKKKAVESINREMMGWLAEIWVEGPDGKTMTIDEVDAFLKDAIDQDPNFNTWLIASTSKLIREFTESVKKGLSPHCSR